MTFLVDTSVWSLALRRDQIVENPALHRLKQALSTREPVATTGIILQELLQGIRGPKQQEAIVGRFSVLPMVSPDLQDHVEAASIRNHCRRNGIHLGTIDALIASLAIRHSLVILTTDKDIQHAAKHVELRIWFDG